VRCRLGSPRFTGQSAQCYNFVTLENWTKRSDPDLTATVPDRWKTGPK
jgi:hypothetical protein